MSAPTTIRARFPVSVKAGSVEVRIYRSRNRSRFVHTVVAYDGSGNRMRQNFADFGRAKVEAERIAAEIQRGEHESLRLVGGDRAAYVRALQLLAPFGQPFDTCVAEYVEARKILGATGSITDAARSHSKAHSSVFLKRRVPDVVVELLAAKKADHRSKRYIQDLSSRLNRFAGEVTGEIGEISTTQLSDWLLSLNTGPRDRNNFRASLISLFNFARQRGYLSKREPTEADSLTKASDHGGDIGYLTFDEMALLLEKADSELLVYYAIGGFAGLRTAELQRLDWKEIDLDHYQTITVTAKKAKTAQRRIVPIQPNLRNWLLPHRRPAGVVFRLRTINQKATQFAREIGIEWPNNALRHSFATYRFAQCKNAPEVAAEMGNSHHVVFRNYRELVQPKEAARWWSLEPVSQQNVVSFSAAEL